MKQNYISLLTILLIGLVFISGCTSSESPTTSGSTITKKFVIDKTYEDNARIASREAVQYCNRNPYGVYETVIYNGDGLGVPFSIEC